MEYKLNDIVELIDKDYVDCCQWIKVGDRYVITDIDKEGRVIIKGLFRSEFTTISDLDKSFKIYNRD